MRFNLKLLSDFNFRYAKSTFINILVIFQISTFSILKSSNKSKSQAKWSILEMRKNHILYYVYLDFKCTDRSETFFGLIQGILNDFLISWAADPCRSATISFQISQFPWLLDKMPKVWRLLVQQNQTHLTTMLY